MGMRTVNRSFAGGEMSPEMFGRIDDVKFQNGAAVLRNMLVKPQGPAFRRPGFAFVREVKDSTRQVKLFPFTYSTDQTVLLEMGTTTVDSLLTGYTRFHIDGATLLYAEPVAISAVDTATEIATTSAAHGLSTGDGVLFPATSSDPPAPLVVDTTYYAIVTDATNLKFSDTYAHALAGTNIVDLSDAGTSGLRSFVPMPRDYVAPHSITSASVGFDNILISADHMLRAGDPVVFTQDGTDVLPGNVIEGTTYYAIIQSSVTIQLAATYADAIAGTPVINISSGGTHTGSTRVHYAYTIGDYANWTGAGVDGPFYLKAANPELYSTGAGAPPTVTSYWYRMPNSGIYEVPNGYVQASLFALNYAQSGDVMTFVHPDHPPYELRRESALRWVWSPIEFGAVLDAPAGVGNTPYRGLGFNIASVSVASPTVISVSTTHNFANGDTVYISGVTNTTPTISDGFYIVHTASGNQFGIDAVLTGIHIDITVSTYASGGKVWFTSLASTNSQSYVVTAVTEDGDESEQSSATTATNNLFVNGAYNDVTWSAVTGAVRYNVYKLQTGLYGYIGQTEALTFRDDNIAPDLGIAPPRFDTSLDGTDYPGAVSYFEGRRVFAGTPLAPQDLWMTKAGTESDLSYTLPVKDSDRIYFRISTREVSTIRHIIGLNQLLLLTNSGEYRVTPLNSDALTPTSISVRPQSYVGSSTVRPQIINNAVVFCAARGGHVRELGYRSEANGFVTGDLSLRAAHLFDNLTIVDSTYSKAPLPIIWMVSSNGILLGLTYVPDESVGAWHWHDTDGLFESACVISEGDEDRLYVVVKRTIDGGTVRYIERMGVMAAPAAAEDAFFVDSGLTYDSTAATAITGLDHLEGETVAILADGIVLEQQDVATGGITLDTSASVVQAGLPFTSQIQTLPLAMQIDGYGQGRTKNVCKAWVRVVDSGNFEIGPDTADLVPGLDAADDDSSLHSTEVEVRIDPAWTNGGQIYVQQADPLPLNVVGLVLETAT